MSAARTWTSRAMSAVPVLLMSLSGVMKLIGAPPVVHGFTEQFGYPLGTLVPIGVLEITCVVVYLIPRTAVLGAILMTGYLGGAVATHTRILDPSGIAPFVLGVLAWGGLYLREDRLRALLPFVAARGEPGRPKP